MRLDFSEASQYQPSGAFVLCGQPKLGTSPRNLGFHYHRERREWFTRDSDAASTFARVASQAALDRLAGWRESTPTMSLVGRGGRRLYVVHNDRLGDQERFRQAGFWGGPGRWYTYSARIAARLSEFAPPELRAQLRLIPQGPLYWHRGRGHYALSSPDPAVADRARRAGFTYIERSNLWLTRDAYVASRLRDLANDEAMARIDAEMRTHRASVADSRATEANVLIPAPEGLEYLPYQKAGIRFALERENTLIADEMGLGKTIQAIGVVNAMTEARRILIICPASILFNWRNELHKWLVRDYDIAVVTEGRSYRDADIVVINYEQVLKYLDRIRKTEWDLMLVDEGHKLKNEKAKRTIAIMGRPAKPQLDAKGDFERDDSGRVRFTGRIPAISARRRIIMTGSPMLNRPRDLWVIARALAPRIFSNFMQFALRYCNAFETKYGWNLDGKSNLHELQEKLRGSFMLRRMKQDVLKWLPPKQRQVIEIQAGRELLAAVRRESEAVAAYDEIRRKIDTLLLPSAATTNRDEHLEQLASLRRSERIAFEQMSRRRAEVGLAKTPIAIDHIDLLLPQAHNGKLVVMCHHKEVANAIADHYAQIAVRIHGDMDPEARQASVDRFRDDPGVQLMVSTIGAGGEGYDMTAASTMLFVELDPVPDIVCQAEDRIHRVTTRYPVLIQYLVLPGSLDARTAQLMAEKSKVTYVALDERTYATDQRNACTDRTLEEAVERALLLERAMAGSLTDARVDQLINEAVVRCASRPGTVDFLAIVRSSATRCYGFSRAELDAVSASVTPEEAMHVIAAARELAPRLTGADACAVQQIGALPLLDAQQAALGMLLCRRHQHLLPEKLRARIAGDSAAAAPPSPCFSPHQSQLAMSL